MTKHIIKNIDVHFEGKDVVPATKHRKAWERRFCGVRIELEDGAGEYRFLINSDQNCCEAFGYITTLDDPAEFVGAEVLGVDVDYTPERDERIFKETFDVFCEVGAILREEGIDPDDTDEETKEYMSKFVPNAVFINVRTNKGDMQFSIYNDHNGYYSHDVLLKVLGDTTATSL